MFTCSKRVSSIRCHLVGVYLFHDGLAGEEEELANLVERLDKASTAYGMEISAEKTKLMTNRGIDTEIKERTELFLKGMGKLGYFMSLI